MARFCQERSKQNRICRKKALLAAARHGTVKLPKLAFPHRHGRAKKCFVRALLAAWDVRRDPAPGEYPPGPPKPYSGALQPAIEG